VLSAPRLLALDVGSKRIGVAVSDHAGMLAHPLTTLEAKGAVRDAQHIQALMLQEEASGVILGMPAHADGTESTSAKRVRKLADALQRLGVPVDFEDEWGSSLDARDALQHISHKVRKDKGLLDQAAAVSILTGYLARRGT